MTTASSAERHLIELMTGFWKTEAVYFATELGVIDRLTGSNPMSGTELALALDLDADALGRLLAYLGSLGVVTGNETDGYALSEVGELLRSDSPSAMRHHMRLYGDHFYRAWGELEHSLRGGGAAFSRVFGSDLFAYLRQNPEASHAYERMMDAGAPFFAEVGRAYDFSRARRIVDVAGGHGSLLDQLLRANPEPRAVLFDAPHVIEESERYPIALDHGDRCERVGGDFFESVPESGDVYLLSRILHCFDDEACHRILANIRRAMAPDGTLVILERLITGEDASLALGFSMHMLVVLGGGRERDEAEYRTMLDKAGFALRSVHALPLETHLLVAAPATIPG
ncbi:methyltransferase [Amycolatopsis anabasis]|uniref:methyltransferase n=1 Tax=Amycolatopsis anabasis TaxID=1840409 RepID=UPI00131B9336|nr:methyltransferase [Amycolatopsis anabasis]